jgi:hypothetical protein
MSGRVKQTWGACEPLCHAYSNSRRHAGRALVPEAARAWQRSRSS